MELPNKFELDYKGDKVNIERINLPGQVIFRVKLPGLFAPIIIGRVLNHQSVKFWTSIPEGNQHIAESIGPLIEEYYKSQA